MKETENKMITQLEFENKWHYKIVKPTGHHNIPDKQYYVTACLLDVATDSDGSPISKFAIMALDYNVDNKHWITFDLSREEIEYLDKKFEIFGEYNNIEEEILLEFSETDENGDLIFTFKNITKGFEGKTLLPQSDFQNYNYGDKIYDIRWISTTGDKMRKAFHLKSSEWNGISNQAILDSFQDVRNWVRGGSYHFSNN